jgi:hypothetical protein
MPLSVSEGPVVALAFEVALREELAAPAVDTAPMAGAVAVVPAAKAVPEAAEVLGCVFGVVCRAADAEEALALGVVVRAGGSGAYSRSPLDIRGLRATTRLASMGLVPTVSGGPGRLRG